jgi:toxin-antitoxin system PIN domain toxin
VTSTLDANVLIYASHDASPYHARARAFIESISEGDEIVYLFWPTLMAYLRIATHPSIFERPLRPEAALENVDVLLSLPHVQTTGEQERFWRSFHRVATDADVRGNLVPDAHLVALMVENGVRRIWTRDRDLRRFPEIDVRDPFG